MRARAGVSWLVVLGCAFFACGESARSGRERVRGADTARAREDAQHAGRDTNRGAPGEWLGFQNNTSPQDREAELRANCAPRFRRVFVSQPSEDHGVTFGELCRSVGATCVRVCDWLGHTRSCDAVSQIRQEPRRDVPLRDGSRIAYCVGSAARAPRPDSTTPAWLAALIQTLEHEPVANPPASILRYTYRGADVYYVPSKCCDVPSVLYDSAGAVVCSPDGGITGKGDGRCTDFFDARRDEVVVWRDPRKR